MAMLLNLAFNIYPYCRREELQELMMRVQTQVRCRGPVLP